MTSMTVLQAVPLSPLTKTITTKAGTQEYEIEQFDRAKYFSAKEKPLASFDDLAAVLNNLIKDRFSCVVRGVVKAGIDKNYFARRKASNPEGGAIEDVDQRWVCLDIDSLPISAVNNDLKAAPGIIRSMLPKCFSVASCWWNFSASQGFKVGPPTVSIHMWFWLDDELSNAELKQYFDLFNKSALDVYGIDKLVDMALFDSIQVHYTAPPDLIGVQDPIAVRSGILPGEPEVKITDDWIRDAPLGGKGATKYIERIGDNADGFHSPILSASAAWVRAYGGSEKTNKEFKTLIRDVIDRADQHKHSKEQIERYKSDYFLDNLIKSAVTKGFDKDRPQIDANTQHFFGGYVYLRVPHKFYSKKDKDVLSVGAFDMVARPFLHGSGGSKIFMDAGGEHASTAMNIPGEMSDSIIKWEGVDVYNKWPGRGGLLLDDYNAAMWEDHIHFLCGNRDAVTKEVLNYFAFVIANPGKKVHWTPILGSIVPGTGKSILKIPLRKIYNGGMTEIGTEDIRNNFNSYMEKELIVVEEVYGPDNRGMVNQIKAKITEDRTIINIKNLPQYEAPNFANFLMFTNHRVPFPMDQFDRRFMLVFNEEKPKEQEYYDKLAHWLETHHDDIYTWACKKDLSKFNSARAPLLTTEKEEAIESSLSALQQLLGDAHESLTWPLQHDLVNVTEVVNALKQQYKFVSNNMITNEFKRLGMKQYYARIINKSGAKINVWVARDYEKYDKLSPGEIRDLMEGKTIGTSQDYWSGGNM